MSNESMNAEDNLEDLESDTGATPGTQTSGQQPGEKPASNPLDYRFTYEDAQRLGLESWAVGRTPAELSQLASEGYQSRMKNEQLPSRTPAMYQEPQAPELPTETELIEDPALAEEKRMTYLRWEMDQRDQRIRQQYESNARATVIGLAQQRYKKDFDRWGPEILGYMNEYNITNMDGVDRVIQLVRGQHQDQVVKEEAERLAREMVEKRYGGSGPRSGTQVGSSILGSNQLDFNSEDIPVERREALERSRATPRQLEGLLSKLYPHLGQKEAMELWLEKVKKADVLNEGT